MLYAEPGTCFDICTDNRFCFTATEQYLSFFEMQTPEVTLKYLVGLSALIRDHLDTMEHGLMRKEGEVRYRAIESYMEAMDTCDDVPSSPSSRYEAK